MKYLSDWQEKLKASIALIRNPRFWKRNQREVLIIAGLIVVVVIIHVALLSPIIGKVRLLQEQIAQERQVAEKYRKKLSEAEQIKQRLARSQQELLIIKEKLFPSNDPYQFATKIEEALSTGDKKDVVIKSYQITSTKELGLYQEVQYSLSLDTNIYGLSQFLSWLDNYSSSVRIGEFNIRYSPRGGKESSIDLVVNLTLTVLMQKKG
ncbi:MAG: hypothetical protein ACP5TY_11955 [Thermodesulforhabdaceae bacterium]|jgi:Tfp pilus assembly protein PilO